MRRLLLPLIASTALLTACGSDDESSSPAPASGEAGGRTVTMKDLQFSPKQLTVKVGEEVTWVNAEPIPHNVVNTKEGEDPESELFGEGGTYKFTPQEAGTIKYVCTIHPGMEGTLTAE